MQRSDFQSILLRDAGKKIQSMFWGNSDGEGGLLYYTECCISMMHRIGAINRELRMEAEKLVSFEKTNDGKCQSSDTISGLRQDLLGERLTLHALMASMKATRTQSSTLNNFVAKISAQIQSCQTSFDILTSADALVHSNIICSETDEDDELEIQEIRADLFVHHTAERQEFSAYQKSLNESNEVEGYSREKLKTNNHEQERENKTNSHEQEPEGEEDPLGTPRAKVKPTYHDAVSGAANAARPRASPFAEGLLVSKPKLRKRSTNPLPRPRGKNKSQRTERADDETRSIGYVRTPRSGQFDTSSLSKFIQSRKAGSSTSSVSRSVVSKQASQDIDHLTQLLRRSTTGSNQGDASSLSRFVKSRKAGSSVSNASHQASATIEQITKRLLRKNGKALKVGQGDTMSLSKFVQERQRLSSKASTPSLQASESISKIAGALQLLNKNGGNMKTGAVERAMSESGWVRQCKAMKVKRHMPNKLENPWDRMSSSTKGRRRKSKRSIETASRASRASRTSWNEEGSTNNSISRKRVMNNKYKAKSKSQCSVYRERLIQEFFEEVRDSGGARGFGSRRKKRNLVFNKEFYEADMVVEVDSIEDYLRF